MSCLNPFVGRSPVHALDPRLRVILALVFSLVMAMVRREESILLGVALACVLVMLARLRPGAVSRRLLLPNLVLFTLFVLVPWSTPGTVWFRVGGYAYSWDGAVRVALVVLRADAILLAVTALVSTMETATLGHALDHLRLPPKLTHLFLFTVRYIEVLHGEYRCLRTAMRLRCFRARCDLHTYHCLGNLVGMLLVRSVERSQRIIAAMKCRGFSGRFWLLDHFVWQRRDSIAAGVGGVLMGVLVWV